MAETFFLTIYSFKSPVKGTSLFQGKHLLLGLHEGAFPVLSLQDVAGNILKRSVSVSRGIESNGYMVVMETMQLACIL